MKIAIIITSSLVIFSAGLGSLIKINRKITGLQQYSAQLIEANRHINKASISLKNYQYYEYYLNLGLAKAHVDIPKNPTSLNLYKISEENYSCVTKIKSIIAAKNLQKNWLVFGLCLVAAIDLAVAIALFKKAYRTKKQAAVKFEEYALEQKAIYNAIVHELGNLIQGIVFANGMFYKLTDPKQVRACQQIESITTQMGRITNSILFLSGHQMPEMHEIDLVTLVVNTSVSSGVTYKGIVITHVPKDPVVFLGNDTLLISVLENLISNAIKYSKDAVEITLTQTDHIEIAVKDKGIGIPKADIPKLFTSFSRASNVGTIKGSGLGLSIVKKVVDLHQGTVQVESEVGVGTTFRIVFP